MLFQYPVGGDVAHLVPIDVDQQHGNYVDDASNSRRHCRTTWGGTSKTEGHPGGLECRS